MIWLLVALAALALLVWQMGRDEQAIRAFRAAVRGIRWGWAIGAVGLYFAAQTILASRWVLLLKVHGVRIGLGRAVELTTSLRPR